MPEDSIRSSHRTKCKFLNRNAKKNKALNKSTRTIFYKLVREDKTKKPNKNEKPLKIIKSEKEDIQVKIVKQTTDTKIVDFQKIKTSSFMLPKQILNLYLPSFLPRITLVLDLDLTLIQAFAIFDSDFLKTNKNLHDFEYINLHMAVILRPHVDLFLETLSQFADIYIYTHGERSYAEILLDQYIDPQRKYIKRDKLCASERDEKQKQKKKLSNLITEEYKRNSCVIFDDQLPAWENEDHSIFS